MRDKQQDYEEASNDNSIAGRFGLRPRLPYDSSLGEPVPQDQIELVLAIRRVERERLAGVGGGSRSR
jgi:hypothetical protein